MRCLMTLLRGLFLVGILGCLLITAQRAGEADEALRYKGDIQPLDAPLLLRYRPGDHYRTTMNLTFVVIGPKQQTTAMSATLETTVRQTVAKLAWDITGRVDANSLDPADNGKISKWRYITDERGHILDMESSDPEFPRDNLMEIFSKVNWLLPADPVLPGQDLMASPISLDLADMINEAGDKSAKETVQQLLLHLDPDAIVAGQTSFAGRRYLVVNVDGDGDIATEKGRVSFEIHGYLLLDTLTAVVSDSVLRAEIDASVNGKSVHAILNLLTATAWD